MIKYKERLSKSKAALKPLSIALTVHRSSSTPFLFPLLSDSSGYPISGMRPVNVEGPWSKERFVDHKASSHARLPSPS